MDAYDVVYVVEPWVTHPPSEECRRDAALGPATGACLMGDLYSSSEGIVEAVKLASEEMDEEVVGAYLQSLGATRSGFLLDGDNLTDIEWAVLESPGPPVGTDAGGFFALRNEAIRRTVLSVCVSDCAGVSARLEHWFSNGTENLSPQQFSLGVIALASEPIENADDLASLVRQLSEGTLDDRFAEGLRRLGALFEKRGTGAVRPSLIGLWADTCPRLGEWDALRVSSDPLSRTWNWIYRRCMDRPADFSDLLVSTSIPTLLLSGRSDTVFPVEAQKAWGKVLSRHRAIDFDGQHVWGSSALSREVKTWLQRDRRP